MILNRKKINSNDWNKQKKAVKGKIDSIFVNIYTFKQTLLSIFVSIPERKT